MSETMLEPINAAAARSIELIAEANKCANSILDQDSYRLAGEMSINIKRAIKHLEEVGGPIVKKTWDAYKTAKALLDDRVKPLTEAEGIIKRGMRAYDDKIIEEQRKAEMERRRLEAEAAAEKKRREDEQLRKAMEAEAAGKKAEAEKIISEPVIEPPAPPSTPIAPLRPIASGVSYRDNWKAEVIDLRTMVKAVAEGTLSVEVLMPNMPMLNAMVKNSKEKTTIPGVKAWNDRIVTQRT